MLLKQPAFTIIAVITLALGIGVNTAIFSVADRLLFRTLPVPQPEQLVLITSVSVSPHFVSTVFSYPDFRDFRAQNNVFSDLVAFSSTQLQLKLDDRIERVAAEFVSANYFDVLGIKAARGRTFTREEDQMPGTQPVVVVSEAFRQKYFAGENPVGKTLTLNEQSLTVTGVAPAVFGGMMLERTVELWVPVFMHGQLAQSKFIENRIRMALGAQPRDVLRVVLRQGILLTAIGLLIGLVAASVAARLFDTQHLYGISPMDAFTFASGAIVLMVVALLACYIPARRATKVDPLVALRYE